MFTGVQVILAVLSVSFILSAMTYAVLRNQITDGHKYKKLLSEMAEVWPHGHACESEFALEESASDGYSDVGTVDELCDCHNAAAKKILGYKLDEDGALIL